MCVVYSSDQSLVDRILLTLAPTLAIIEFDNFMSKVQQAEGIASNHEPAKRSEICQKEKHFAD